MSNIIKIPCCNAQVVYGGSAHEACCPTQQRFPQPLYWYTVLICGGPVPNPWEREVEVQAESLFEAVKRIYPLPLDGEIISVERKD